MKGRELPAKRQFFEIFLEKLDVYKRQHHTKAIWKEYEMFWVRLTVYWTYIEKSKRKTKWENKKCFFTS